jgi:S-DNA-T family DNA segregation ATPase FtsK/SpoIIIE
MIMSILYKATPDDVRFLMIDPKMLELSLYENIPHLLTRVVTDPREASAVLNRAVIEMDDRYRLLRDKGVRNIESYNRVLESESEEKSSGSSSEGRRAERADRGFKGWGERARHREARASAVPYLVIVIDELADLMLTSGREVEEQIRGCTEGAGGGQPPCSPRSARRST